MNNSDELMEIVNIRKLAMYCTLINPALLYNNVYFSVWG